MRKPDNIEQFRKCTGVVLSQLYDAFPCPTDIDVYYIEGNPRNGSALVNFDDEMHCWGKQGNSAARNPIKSELLVYTNTVHFLLREGYIHASEKPAHDQDQRRFSGVTLTSKGLAALGHHDSVDQAPIGNALRSAVRDGKYGKVQEIVVKLLAWGATAV